MRLCDTDIERYLDEGLISLSPRPSNDKINGATIDVRLGNSFRVFREHSAPYIGDNLGVSEITGQYYRLAGRTFFFSAFGFNGACDSTPYRSGLGRQNCIGVL